MAYLGNQPSTGENNSFKILDDISSYTLTFDGSSSSVVSTSDNTITDNAHRFITGQRVTYTNGSGSDIVGLTDGNQYYIIKSDQNTIKLAANATDAANDVEISLSALGTGSDHTLNVAFDSVNTKFKATYNNGTKAKMTRAAQLTISINGVIQQPQDTSSPTNGFGFDLDSVIVFSTAPASTDAFWGHIVANNFASFDISDNTVDSFTGDDVTTDFTLSKSPANNQNVLVTLDGVVQYPSDATTTKAYSVTENVISFASAPGLGVDIQVRHIGFAGATSSAVTGFYGRTGNVTFKDTDSLTVANIVASSGISTLSDLVVTGDLTVQGTTTTLDTLVTEVDKLEVAASNTNVAVAVTQSSTGDILRLYDGTSQVVTVADGGFVGIGTDNPSAPLHILSSEDRGIFIESTDANAYIVFKDTDTSSDFANRVGTISDGLYFNTGGGGERLRITSSGRLSIGNYSSPKAPLHIRGEYLDQAPVAGVGTGSLVISNQDTDYGINFGVRSSGSGWIQQTRVDGTGTNYSLLLNPLGGNVGIGTDNPAAELEVYGNARFKDIDGSHGIEFYPDVASLGYQRIISYNRTSTAYEDLSIGVNDFVVTTGSSSERLRITSGGDVGIGTTNPDKKLRVEGDARITGTLTMGTASIEIAGDSDFPTIRPTLDLNFAATKTLDRRITFTRDSIGTYTDELGIIRTAPNNVPRFDHDPETGESLGLLIEESRTNLFTNSQLFNYNWTNVRSSESGTTATADPEGFTTGAAFKLVANTDNNTHRLDKTGLSMSVSTTYTMSLWAKAAEYSGVSLTIADSSNAANGVYFDLSAGTLTTGGNAHSGSMIAYPNGWYRCIATYTTPASISFNQCLIGVLEDGTTKSYTGDNSSGIYIWGAQLEQGSFATSYIETPNAGTSTRAADFAKITGTNFTDFYGDTDHSFFVDFDLKNTSSTDSMAILTLPSATYPWLLYRYIDDYWKSFNGSDSIVNVSSTYSQTNNKFAFAIGSSNGSSAYNGSLTQTNQTLLRTGLYSNASSILLFTRGSDFIPSGYLKQLKYYPKRLTNAQLQSLTRQ